MGWDLEIEQGSVEEYTLEDVKDRSLCGYRALQVLDNILDVGKDRPLGSADLSEKLEAAVVGSSRDAVERLSSRSLWVSKSSVSLYRRCAGSYRASKEVGYKSSNTAALIGDITHVALQMTYTHPGRGAQEYVEQALEVVLNTDSEAGKVWSSAGMGEQSSISMAAIGRVTSFMDLWPTLDKKWQPRFEENTQVRYGRLVLSGTPDLVLGRARPDNRQTMILVDYKTGGLNDEHMAEAQFYAIVSTLRHHVMPYKSVVYSLAQADWIEYIPTQDSILEAGEKLGEDIVGMCEALHENTQPVLTPGRWCSWCALSTACPSSSLLTAQV